jgi:phosphomevalonate kinase
MSSFITTSPGKTVIAGEYAVLFGYRALAAAIDRKATCSFSPQESFDFFMKTIGPPVHMNDHPLFIAVLKACSNAGFIPHPGSYMINTEHFYSGENHQKLGLGSSAAAMTALCKMILAQNLVYDTNQVFTIAKNAHYEFSSESGSGIDIATSVFGGIISYQFGRAGPKINKLELAMLWDHILFIDTNQSQDTRPFVQSVRELKKSKPDYILNFCQLSSSLCTLLINTNKDIFSAIKIFDNFFYLLKDLGEQARINIVTEEHIEIHSIAKTFSGSMKPSGAGGGDICLAMVPAYHRASFIKKINNLGFLVLNLSIS